MISAIVLSVLGFFVGGVLFRARGGWPSIPRPFEQMAFCSVFLVAGFFLPAFTFMIVSKYVTIALVYALCVAAVLKGHGRNMDLGHSVKPNHTVEPEWYEFVLKPLVGKIPEYWYDVVGIGVSGLTYTLPLVVFHPLLAFTGILKAPAYMIGRALHPNHNDGPKIEIGKFTIAEATEWGEVLTGAFIWSVTIFILTGVLL